MISRFLLTFLLLCASPALYAEVRPKSTVKLYGASWCPLCRGAEEYLRSREIDFVRLDIDKDPSARASYQAIGVQGVPILIIGREILRGFDPGAIEAALAGIKTND